MPKRELNVEVDLDAWVRRDDYLILTGQVTAGPDSAMGRTANVYITFDDIEMLARTVERHRLPDIEHEGDPA